MPEIVNKIRKLTGLTLGKMKPMFRESLYYKVIFVEVSRVGIVPLQEIVMPEIIYKIRKLVFYGDILKVSKVSLCDINFIS